MYGQRAFVGLVSMDMNSPASYCSSSTADSLREAEEFVKWTLKKNCGRVHPVITPRFIPTCSEELLCGLASIALEHKVMIQSHLSESVAEVAFSKSLHPDCGSDLQIFRKVGMVGEDLRCVFAHATCLTSQDIAEIASSKGAGLREVVSMLNLTLSTLYPSDIFSD